MKKIISERGLRLEFIVLKGDGGKENFFYVLMKEPEYEEMMKRIGAGKNINPENYGFIIYQGVGNTPPQEIEEKILALFN